MRYLRLFETFKTHQHYATTVRHTPDSSKYYFTSDKNWEYEVSFYKKDQHDYFFGFKAKRPDDYFYDKDVLTNDNPYQIISTIKAIVLQHYQQFKPNRYIFSVQATDKIAGHKRKNFYIKLLQQLPDWTYTKDPDMDRWYLCKTS